MLSYMPKITRTLFHLAVLCDSLRCGAYGTFCYGISCNVMINPDSESATEREKKSYARSPCISLQRGIVERVPWCKDHMEPLPIESQLHRWAC